MLLSSDLPSEAFRPPANKLHGGGSPQGQVAPPKVVSGKHGVPKLAGATRASARGGRR